MKSVQADKLEAGIAQLELQLPPEVVARLMAYLALLVKWNSAYNLTAVRDPEQMVVRHLLDSLSILPALHGRTLIDVGTGAGLPGLVLALAEPALEVALLDSNGKKVRFLRQAIAELGMPNARAVQGRVEEFPGCFEIVTSRAFATLADMVNWSAHLLEEQGEMLAMKGTYPQAEIAALPAGFAAQAVVPLKVPFLNEERHLVRIRRGSA